MDIFIDFLDDLKDFNNSSLIECIESGYRLLFETSQYHYGDMGTGSDTYLGRMGASDVGSGHFGTGTYFMGTESNYLSKTRPTHNKDLSGYNLYRPVSESKGLELHNLLRKVNSLIVDRNNLNSRIPLLNKALSSYFNKSIDITDLVDICIGEYDTNGINSKANSLSTLLMKRLGYQGVDISGYDMLDNSMYGSVVYEVGDAVKPNSKIVSRNKTVNRHTMRQFTFAEKEFTTTKGNIVKCQVIPSSDSVEFAFTVNDSFDDLASGGYDPEIMSGVMYIFKKLVEKNKYPRIEIKPKNGPKDYRKFISLDIVKSYDLANASIESLLSNMRDNPDAYDKWFIKRMETEPLINKLGSKADEHLIGEPRLNATKPTKWNATPNEYENQIKLYDTASNAVRNNWIAMRSHDKDGHNEPRNRRADVFIPLVKRILPNYTLENFYGTYIFNLKDRPDSQSSKSHDPVLVESEETQSDKYPTVKGSDIVAEGFSDGYGWKVLFSYNNSIMPKLTDDEDNVELLVHNGIYKENPQSIDDEGAMLFSRVVANRDTLWNNIEEMVNTDEYLEEYNYAPNKEDYSIANVVDNILTLKLYRIFDMFDNLDDYPKFHIDRYE